MKRDGLNNTYSYDAQGQRATWSGDGAQYQYLYDPSGGLLGVFSAQTGSWFFETVAFEGQRRFDYLNGNLCSYHPDALGTVRLVTQADGSVYGDNLLYPWGQSWTYSGSSTNLFAGFQNWDGNVGAPMYPGQFRVYPVNYGRWLTPDPAGKKAVRLDDPQTWNAYAYVRSNPTTLTDPSGLLTPAGGVDPFESTHVYTGTIESIDQGTEERPAGEKAQQQDNGQSQQNQQGQNGRQQNSKELTGDATYYNLPGSKLAYGGKFDPNKMAAAMTPDRAKDGQTVTVTYTLTDAKGNVVKTTTIQVVVNDTGPFARNPNGTPMHPLRPDPVTIIDLTPAAFKQLTGGLGAGRVPVTVTVPNE